MHPVNSIVLYTTDKSARLGVVVELARGSSRPYLIYDRSSKVRLWVSEAEIVDSILPAQPSKSRAMTPEG